MSVWEVHNHSLNEKLRHISGLNKGACVAIINQQEAIVKAILTTAGSKVIGSYITKKDIEAYIPSKSTFRGLMPSNDEILSISFERLRDPSLELNEATIIEDIEDAIRTLVADRKFRDVWTVNTEATRNKAYILGYEQDEMEIDQDIDNFLILCDDGTAYTRSDLSGIISSFVKEKDFIKLT